MHKLWKKILTAIFVIPQVYSEKFLSKSNTMNKCLCCVATPDTNTHSTICSLFTLSFRLLLQRANKKPRELSKRPRRSFPSRHRPSSSVTCRYDIRSTVLQWASFLDKLKQGNFLNFVLY